MSIRGFDRAEVIRRVPLTDAAVRRFFVPLHVQPMAPRVVLKPPARHVEGFLDDEGNVLAHAFDIEPLRPLRRVKVLRRAVQVRAVRDGDLLVGHPQVDAHAETVAFLMVLVGDLHDDVARHDVAAVGVELGGPRADFGFDPLVGIHASERDGHRELHGDYLYSARWTEREEVSQCACPKGAGRPMANTCDTHRMRCRGTGRLETCFLHRRLNLKEVLP